METNQAKIYNMSDIPMAAYSKDAAVQAKASFIGLIKKYNITAEDFNALAGFLDKNQDAVSSAIRDVKAGKSGFSVAGSLIPKLFKSK